MPEYKIPLRARAWVIKRIFLLCLLMTAVFILFACTAEEIPPPVQSAPAETEETEEAVELFPLDKSYAVVSSMASLDGYASRGITLILENMSILHSVRPSLTVDTRSEPIAHEIIIGNTTREESVASAAALAEMDGRGLHIFLAQTVGEKLILTGNTGEAIACGTQWFIDTYLAGGAHIPADLCEIRYVTAEDFAVHKTGAPLYDAAALAEIADLHTITLDGVPMEEFRTDRTEYTLTLPRGTKIPAVAAEGIAGTTVTAASAAENTFIFRVASASGQNNKEYKVNFMMDKYNYPAVKIEKTPAAADSIAVIVHDDGTPTTVSWMAEEFEKYDLRGTVALVSKKVIENGVRKEEDIAYWQSILDTGRFGFSSHTRTHKYWGRSDAGDSGTYVYTQPDPIPYTIEPGRITSETLGSKEDILSCFPGERILTFVKAGFGKNTDGTQVTPEAYEIIKKYYITMRNTGGGVDTIPPTDPYNVRSYMVKNTDTAADLIAYTDKAVEKGGMIVYLFHRIEGDLCSEASQLFARISELQKANKLWCTTFEEASLYTEELRTAKAFARQDDEAITLTLTDEWDNTVYDHPLTVRVEITENWTDVRVRYGDGKEEILPVQRDDQGAYVHVKAVPDSGDIRITAK